MYRRYYSYNDMPQLPIQNQSNSSSGLVRPEPIKPPSPPPPPPCKKEKTESSGAFNLDSIFKEGKVLGKFELDDILLCIVIFVLLMDDCDDKILLLALGFVLFSNILFPEE